MVSDPILPADERRHPPGRGPSGPLSGKPGPSGPLSGKPGPSGPLSGKPGTGWEESWYLDFVAADGGLAGYVRLTLRPGEGTAWFWAGMVGGGPALVTVRDHEVQMPSGRGLEVRASGLWTELVCETPLDHWSVGLEAFGVALDDPLEAWRRERGDPWALGLDVEWEAAGGCQRWPGGYWQGCAVHGDVLVGAERFSLDGTGTRVHQWGDRPRSRASGWAAGRLEDGTSFAVADPVVTCDTEGRICSGTFMVDGAEVTAAAVAQAPVLLPGEGRLARALCRYEATGGRSGHGWAEWFLPAGSGPAQP